MLKELSRGEAMALAALLLFFLTLFALPLGLLARVGLTDAGVPSLGPLIEALQNGSVRRAAWRSLESAAGEDGAEHLFDIAMRGAMI